MIGTKGNCARILEYLKSHEGITSKEAFEHFGATRLSAIIFCLRKSGYNIVNIPQNGKNRFGESVHYDQYRLIEA
jgi:hypothetical protein